MRTVGKKAGYRSLLVSAFAIPLSIIFARTVLHFDFLYRNESLLQTLQMFSALTAFGAGIIAGVVGAFAERRRDSYYPSLSATLLTMATISAVLAIRPTVDERYVLLESTAQVVGCLFAVSVWFLRDPAFRAAGKIFPAAAVLVSLLAAWGALRLPSLPAVLSTEGTLGTFPLIIDLFSATLYSLSALYFFRCFRERQRSSDLVFCHFAILNAFSDIFWPGLHVWGPIWWSWHFFQAAAYVFALGYLAVLHATLESDLEGSERRFKTLAGASFEGVLLVEDGIIRDCNAIFATLVGRCATQLRGLSLHSVVSELTHVGDESTVRELTLTLRGRTFPAEVLSKKEGALRIIVVRDLSEKKRAGEKLKELNQELKRSNAELERFAYVASHDLLEPLRTISSFLSLLDRRAGAQLDPDARQYLSFARDGANRLRGLIGGLLSYARVGAQSPRFVHTDGNEVLAQVVDNLHALVTESGASIEWERLPTVPCSPELLQLLFQNLLVNALRYRSERAPCVRIGATQERGEWRFFVTDNGVGIAPEDQERIFALFTRLQAQDTSGAGIGLATCKKITERLGGKLWVESEPGVGSTFYFSLPLDDAAAERA